MRPTVKTTCGSTSHGAIACLALGSIVLTLWGACTLTGQMLSTAPKSETRTLGETTFAHLPEAGAVVIVVSYRHPNQSQPALYNTPILQQPGFYWYHRKLYHWRKDCPLLELQRHKTYLQSSTMTLREARKEGAIPCSVCANSDDLQAEGRIGK